MLATSMYLSVYVGIIVADWFEQYIACLSIQYKHWVDQTLQNNVNAIHNWVFLTLLEVRHCQTSKNMAYKEICSISTQLPPSFLGHDSMERVKLFDLILSSGLQSSSTLPQKLAKWLALCNEMSISICTDPEIMRHIHYLNDSSSSLVYQCGLGPSLTERYHSLNLDEFGCIACSISWHTPYDNLLADLGFETLIHCKKSRVDSA